MDDEATVLSVGVGVPTTNRSFFPPARAPMKSKRSSCPARTSYIRFCKDKRQLLPPNLRNAERERLLGQWWRALPEAEKAAYAAAEGAVHGEGAEEQYTVEKAQFNIVDAAYPYHPVAAAATEWVHVPPLPPLPIIAPFVVPRVPPLMAWHTGGTSGWHKGGPSAPSAPVAPALPPVPMGTSVVLAKPVTPVVAAAPLQLQLQELLMQTLEQMAEEEAEVM